MMKLLGCFQHSQSPFRLGNKMKSSRLLAMISMAVLLGAIPQTTVAQTVKPMFKQTRSSLVEGLSDLKGSVPNTRLCTSGRPKQGSKTGIEKKIFMLYNVGTGQFFSQGGTYGTHATLSSVPYLLWLECDSTSSTVKYYLATNAESNGSNYYLGTSGDPHSPYADVFLVNARTIIYFKKVDNSDGKNIYNIQVGGNGWQHIVALPNGNTVSGELRAYDKVGFRWLTDEDAASYPENAQWKLISLAEYYELFEQEPASMTAPVDATFRLMDADFRINSSQTDMWQTTGDVASVIRFGDETMYRVHSSQGGSASNWTGMTDAHQRAYGRLTYAYAKGMRSYMVYQDVEVKQPGWYLVRCKGMSSQNAIADESSPLAYLFVSQLDASGEESTIHTASVSLRSVTQDDVAALEASEDGCGIGVAFDDQTWQRQTQLCVDSINGEPISETNPATLRLGWKVLAGSSTVSDDEITAVDQFDLLYAGERRKPELILNEDETDLKYITLAVDAYQNNVLHLKRTLNPNVWNTIILPVTLNRQQVLNAFGADVKLAKLVGLNEKSILFATVETSDDNDEMLQAFTPYIIKPSNTNVVSEAYTVDRFYTNEYQNKWLSTSYEEIADETDVLRKSVDTNHFVIPLVTLERDSLYKHLNDYDSSTGESTWELNASDAVAQSGTPGTISCTGTFAKTYDATGTDGANEIISGRDDLNGAFFMYKGSLIQVPTGNKESGEKYQYGIKGFRCWFRLAENASKNAMSVVVDGITDQTTRISDVGTDSRMVNASAISGVYNLNGQQLRRTSDTIGLPKGIYVVEGRKMVVR